MQASSRINEGYADVGGRRWDGGSVGGEVGSTLWPLPCEKGHVLDSLDSEARQHPTSFVMVGRS